MKWLRGGILAVVLTAFAVPAASQIRQPTYTPVAAPDTEHLVWDSGRPYGYLPWAFPWLHGPYSALVTSQPGSPTIDIYCVDMEHNAITGRDGWHAYFTPIARDADFSNTRNPGSPRGYFKAAWLASKMQLSNKRAWGSIHAGIWNIFSSGAPELALHSDAIRRLDRAWGDEARGFDPKGWYVVSDQRGVGQEFVTYVNVVPEPATLILMGTGLIAVAGMTLVMRQSVG